jgi:hypothetical protein
MVIMVFDVQLDEDFMQFGINMVVRGLQEAIVNIGVPGSPLASCVARPGRNAVILGPRVEMLDQWLAPLRASRHSDDDDYRAAANILTAQLAVWADDGGAL